MRSFVPARIRQSWLPQTRDSPLETVSSTCGSARSCTHEAEPVLVTWSIDCTLSPIRYAAWSTAWSREGGGIAVLGRRRRAGADIDDEVDDDVVGDVPAG